MLCAAAPRAAGLRERRGAAPRAPACRAAPARRARCPAPAAPTAPAPRGRSPPSVAPRAAAAAAGAAGAAAPPAVPPPAVCRFDFVVIGSGIAGLSYALKVAPHGSVAVITKDAAGEGCTAYAQGGVCAVLDPLDSVERHVRDTLVAGAFLNDPK
jgi:hypothetical protein